MITISRIFLSLCIKSGTPSKPSFMYKMPSTCSKLLYWVGAWMIALKKSNFFQTIGYKSKPSPLNTSAVNGSLRGIPCGSGGSSPSSQSWSSVKLTPTGLVSCSGSCDVLSGFGTKGPVRSSVLSHASASRPQRLPNQRLLSRLGYRPPVSQTVLQVGQVSILCGKVTCLFPSPPLTTWVILVTVVIFRPHHFPLSLSLVDLRKPSPGAPS